MDELCPVCEAGHLNQVNTTYVQVYAGTLVHAPNVAAWKCDICGGWFFDPAAIRRVDVLVGEAGPPPNHHTPAPAANTPRPTDDTPDAVQPSSA